jgi:hypothetical protein
MLLSGIIMIMEIIIITDISLTNSMSSNVLILYTVDTVIQFFCCDMRACNNPSSSSFFSLVIMFTASRARVLPIRKSNRRTNQHFYFPLK